MLRPSVAWDGYAGRSAEIADPAKHSGSDRAGVDRGASACERQSGVFNLAASITILSE
jgi:hypothetical protein